MDLNKVYNMDCLEGMKLIEDGSVDLVITSPPYWKGFEYEAYFNSYGQYMRWSKRWMAEVKRILNKKGYFFLNVINDSEVTTRAFELMQIATEELMFKLHDTIIWYRYNQQPANTVRQLTNQVEYIFMFKHTSANTTLNKSEVYENFSHVFKTKNVGNVWEIPFNSGKQKNKGFGRKETKGKWGHSGFPIEIAEIPILLSTQENDIVLDPFMGSGTTAVGCINTNRNFIGFELDKKYCDIANERVAKEFKLTEEEMLNGFN